MKRTALTIFVVCMATMAFAQQTIDEILMSIAQNNTTLLALQKQMEAEKGGNKTGIYLENPEIELHYLWGNNAEVGTRIDFSALQSFDFPTAYHHKGKVAGEKNRVVDLSYQIERAEILFEARKKCIEQVYLNALSAELALRLQHAKQIADAYQLKFDKGDCNILELNKSKLNLLNTQREVDLLQIEKERKISELIQLNGQQPLVFSIKEYFPVALPENFETWYRESLKNNLSMKQKQHETMVNLRNEKLQRSLNLPKFSAGYMSEKTTFEHFQGVMIGVSIPLWENKNTMRQIKTQIIASLTVEADTEIRFKTESQSLFLKAGRLRKMASEYAENLNAVTRCDLLKKALDVGEISLIDYILELSVYYEAINNRLETERDYQLTLAELNKWNDVGLN